MLPRFAVALPQDALLQSTPPFDFPGVSMRVFPLRSDMTRVQSLVDGWLNHVLPPEIAYFRAFSPYVMLVALNYGRAAVIPSNLGWSSQKEVTFSIPLQWYRRTRRGFELQDFAILTPFIFVDNDLSIPAGREVFGWQKNLIWMDPLADRWMTNPRAPTKHAGISTRAFREVYAGKQEQPMPFVAIDEAPQGAAIQYPADRQNPLLPWVSLYNAMDSAGGLAQDMIDLLIGLGLIRRRSVPLRGGRTGWLDPGDSVAASIQTILRAIDPYDPDLRGNQINLKQFRDAERPMTACYQDVNNTVMRVREINRFGLLGEMRVLLGDVSGGYRITLHQWESLPIADMLGLESRRSTDVDGATVVSLKPVLPVWADMDLLYADERRVIAWRSKDHPWTPGPGAGISARAASYAAASRSAGDETGGRGHRVISSNPSRGELPPRDPEKIPYNTTLGSSSPVIYGPFETPKATLRVLPLLATESKLAELVDRALNEPLRGAGSGEEQGGSGFSFEPWGRYVYLAVQTADNTYSVDNNVGSWESKAVRFLVPVRRFRDGMPDGFALYCPFSFSASTLDAVSASEINGMQVMSARIDSPSSTWLEENGPAVGRGRDLAVLRAMIPPILEAGERARTRTILKVSQRGTDGAELTDEELNPHWAPRIKRDLERRRGATHARPLPASRDASATTGPDRPPPPAVEQGPSNLDVARAHAIDLLGDQAPLRFVALKQFRDVARPDRACYQALVEVEQRFLHVERVEEITAPLEVILFDYESMPIAKTLGLVHRSVGYHRGLRCRKLEPVRPFWMTAMLREELGKNLAEQRRDLSWVRRARPTPVDPQLASDSGASPGEPAAMESRTAPGPGEMPSPAAAPPPVDPERVAAPGDWTEAERLANLRRIDLGKPRRIAQLLTVERGRQSDTSATLQSAPAERTDGPAAAIGAVEPQWVIETLLSREWESRSSPVWLHHKREIERAAEEARGGFKAFTEQAMSEIKELVSQRKLVADKTHHDILSVVDAELLPRFAALAWISAESRHLNEVAFAHRQAEVLGPLPGQPPPPRPAARGPLVNAAAAAESLLSDVFHFAGDAAGEPPAPAPPPPPAPAPEPPPVGSLYDESGFDALENEVPDLVRRAEDVMLRDVAVGGLLETLLSLCGEDAANVVKSYSDKVAHVSPEAILGAVPAGSPMDIFLHFSPEEEVEGSSEPPPDEHLPEGLADDLEKEATATLATARTLVYLAWKNAASDPVHKHPVWVEFVTRATREVDCAREELILALAKCWQKPFFCVRRDTAPGDDVADALFPHGHCWTDRNGVAWYSPEE